MGKWLCSALAFVGALLAAPLAAAQTVGVPIQVSTGDVFTVQVDYTQSTVIGEQPIDARFGYVYTIEVLNAEQRLWRFMPVSVSYEFPSGLGVEAESLQINWAAVSDAFSAIMRIATDVGFECRVDEYGRCLELTNWPFWAARVEDLALMTDAFLRLSFPAAAPSGSERPAVTWETVRVPTMQGIARLIDAYDARDAAAGVAGMFIPAYLQGRTLTRRQNVDVVHEYDMPWGAPPLRFTGTMRLERIDRRANTGTVVRRVSLDRESVRASVRSMTQFVTDNLVTPLASYFPEDQQPPSAEALLEMIDLGLNGLSYEETTTGVIDLATGWARETTTDFTVTMAPPEAAGGGDPMTARGRIVTRVTAGRPPAPRLPRR